MDALGVNVSGLLTQIVSFAVLFGLLLALLYKPLLRVMDQRSLKIKESLESAQKASDEAARSREDMQRQLEAARAEGQEMIAQARQVADRFREDELARAREEIESERTKAQANIQRERDAAIEDLRREFGGLAITAAERVVEHSLDEAAHRDVIERVLEEGPEVGRR